MLSLADFSPLSVIPRGHILVVHKGYFDGGNQADSTQYDIVTLAAFSGSAIQWKNFERRWIAKLKKHGAPETSDGSPWIHTTDAVGLTRDFSKRNGWDEKKVDLLLTDCVSIIDSCGAVRKESAIVRDGIRAVSVSVLLKDFQRALQEIPDLGTVEHICCAPVLHYGIHVNFPGNVKFQLFFDTNEPFFGHVLDRVRNRESKKVDPIWKNVISITEGEMRSIPGLQAADLLAWSINDAYKHSSPRFGWQQRLLQSDRDKQWFDYARLMKPRPPLDPPNPAPLKKHG